MTRGAVAQPVVAGMVAAIVGFTSSFAVVLAGLRAAGASDAQAASGLLAVCVGAGVCAIALGLRTRLPLAMAWSTPGAALLVTTGTPTGGWPAAVGAFAVCGGLIVLAGLWRPLARGVAAIPAALASAMLAGVLLGLCVAPARAVAALPLLAGPVVVAWALLARFAPRWAVPGAIVVAAGAVAIDGPGDLSGLRVLPTVEVVAPSLHAGALLSIALPLFIVTMASQNISGMTVLATFGYRPALRPILAATGAATVVAAPFGGHAVNLAAISAALAAGPDAGPDRSRRWIASVVAGGGMIALGLCAGLATTLISASPPLLVQAVAGLALLGALAGALTAALADEERRDAAAVTFVVSASGVTALGIGASFWGLTAGVAMLGVLRVGRSGRAGSGGFGAGAGGAPSPGSPAREPRRTAVTEDG